MHGAHGKAGKRWREAHVVRIERARLELDLLRGLQVLRPAALMFCPLTVRFEGEEGVDEAGLKVDAFGRSPGLTTGPTLSEDGAPCVSLASPGGAQPALTTPSNGLPAEEPRKLREGGLKMSAGHFGQQAASSRRSIRRPPSASEAFLRPRRAGSSAPPARG